MKKKVIVAAFRAPDQAREAVASLRDNNFASEMIGILAKDGEGQVNFNTFKELEGHHAGKGAAIGVAAGAGTGVLWALGISAGLLPAIGPIVAGGLLGAIAASGAAGAAVAGLAGSLVGLGISDEEAAYYESEFERGAAIVTVICETPEDLILARSILNERHAYYGPSSASVVNHAYA